MVLPSLSFSFSFSPLLSSALFSSSPLRSPPSLQVLIQGDVLRKVAEHLTKHYRIPSSLIETKGGGKKRG